ncbi:MAG: TolC family protein, partial [Hymenobacteraceae bacterium]|nr:TolC family protein [Hymenobacteraceae bacterium]MDX5396783.1 TolC family protein [Hymenobacteraceae bacterium]MDX5512846.1 TolC family protein [Hymenobacteraceae bacterium]
MINRLKRVPVLLWALLVPWLAVAQTQPEAPGQPLTLNECISYAMANQPEVKQAELDEAIGEREIKAELSGWLPQIGLQFNASHNFKLQTTAFGDQLITIGKKNNSNLLLQANQTLYSNEVFFASRAARFTRLSLDQNTINQKINTVVDVSKAFYDVLLTQEQLRILDENIVRQEKQYSDALSRYEVGLVDKTDYQRASITLANIRADRKRSAESIKGKKAYLKQVMGFPADSELNLAFENALMEQEILVDTTQNITYTNRIEYQQLQTQQQLLNLNTSYYRRGFLPTVSAFANYNWLYLNDEFSQLYNQSYPTSQAGLSVALPIFQGTRRLQNVKIAQLREQRLEVEIQNTRNIINTQYQTALANYKSDLNEYRTLRRNAEVAEEVYNIIKLQYDEG